MIDKIRTPPPILEEAFYRRSLDSSAPIWSYHNHVLQGSLLRYIRRPLKRKDVAAYRLALVGGLHKGSLCELKLHAASTVNTISLIDEDNDHPYAITVSGYNSDGKTSTWQLALATSEMQAEWVHWLKLMCNFVEGLETTGEMEQLLDLSRAMLPHLRIRNRLHQFTIYPKCFLGNNAVRVLMSQHNISTANAVAICNRLMSAGLLEHVTHEHVFCNGRRYYRLTNVNGCLEADELSSNAADFDPFAALTNDEPEEPAPTVIQSPLLVLTLSLRREVKKIASELSREKKLTEALKAKYDAQCTAYMCTAEARETPPSLDNFMNGINVVLLLTSMWLIVLGFYPFEVAMTITVILVASFVYFKFMIKTPDASSVTPVEFGSSDEILRSIEASVEHMDDEEEEEEFDGDGIDSDDDDDDDVFDLLLCDQCIASHEESIGNHGRLSLGLSSPTPATSPMHDTTSTTGTTGGRERTDSVDIRLRRRLTDSLSKLRRMSNPLATPNRDTSVSSTSFQGAGTYDDIALEVSSTTDHDKYSFREMYQPARWPNRPILLKRCASGVPQNVLLNDEARKEWLKPIPLHKEENVCMSEFPIETDYFIGKGYMVIDGLVDSPSSYFSCRRHKFRVVIQGRFKETIPFAKAYTGQTYESPIGNLPAKWLIRTVLLLLSRMQPALKVRLDGDHPFVLSPLASTAQNIVVSQPGNEINISSNMERIKEDLSLLGPQFTSMSNRQRKRFFSKRCVGVNRLSICTGV